MSSHWFVDNTSDKTPICPVNIIPDDNSMWLVNGPSDPRPMPLHEKLDSKKARTKSPSLVATEEMKAKMDNITSSTPLPELLPIKEDVVRLALIGATGLVGRACSTYIAQHPELKFVISHFVGSALSEGKTLSQVASEKEAMLKKVYGEEFWDSSLDVDVGLLANSLVCDVEKLLNDGPESCDIVLSFLAPRFGDIEDAIINQGFRLVSISPHDRMSHPLIVPIVNGSTFDFGSSHCMKSPNCCSVGSSVALLPIMDTFNVEEIFITTFQSLSGRGDAPYPNDKVINNVYPIGLTEEKTEFYIAQEISKIYAEHPKNNEISSKGRRINESKIHVSSYRVSVQKNHLLDIRVRISETLDAKTFKAFISAVYNQVKYKDDIIVEEEIGQPRPKSHFDSFKVRVGNFDLETQSASNNGGGSFIRVSATVDNVGKGAWGNAIEISERIVKMAKAAASSS